jgi:hypothetical protein
LAGASRRETADPAGELHTHASPGPAKPHGAACGETRGPFIEDWVYWADPQGAETEPATQAQAPLSRTHGVRLTEGIDAGSHEFYFVIRLAECALPLLCQIIESSPAAAKQRLKELRNLIEWRMIDRVELAELLKEEGWSSL